MSFPKHGRVLFTATLVRGHIAKFHIPYLKWFKEQGWETWVAAKNDYPDGVCEIPWCDHFVNIDFARSPFSKQTFVAYRQLCDLFVRERFDIVHTHTPVGGVLTRLAARDARRAGAKVIYTAHGFHFYKGAPLANWLLWYPVERVMSRFADVLITINKEDYKRAKHFAHCRVEYVPGVGVDLSKFMSAKGRDAQRQELGLAPSDFAVLAIGDLNDNKNHRILVEAIAGLPVHVKLFIAGEGPLRDELRVLASRLGVANRVSLLGFRRDVAELLNACDLFCLPSKREGLPVSLIEAMAAGTLCLASDVRGSSDLLEAFRGVGMVASNTASAWIKGIREILELSDKERAELAQGYQSCAEQYGYEAIVSRYESIVHRCLTCANCDDR